MQNSKALRSSNKKSNKNNLSQIILVDNIGKLVGPHLNIRSRERLGKTSKKMREKTGITADNKLRQLAHVLNLKDPIRIGILKEYLTRVGEMYNRISREREMQPNLRIGNETGKQTAKRELRNVITLKAFERMPPTYYWSLPRVGPN